MTNVEAGQLPIFSLYHQYLQPDPCLKHQYIGPMLAKLKLEFFKKKFLGIAFSFFLLRNKFAKLRRCVAGYFAKIHSGNLKVVFDPHPHPAVISENYICCAFRKDKLFCQLRTEHCTANGAQLIVYDDNSGYD